ncbi:hypothetical protein EV426DRAFT_414993 [Tirmania nivea]|nr:hypothetical protein EV426DRAFT_414993 [Tirmania nivea]
MTKYYAMGRRGKLHMQVNSTGCAHTTAAWIFFVPRATVRHTLRTVECYCLRRMLLFLLYIIVYMSYPPRPRVFWNELWNKKSLARTSFHRVSYNHRLCSYRCQHHTSPKTATQQASKTKRLMSDLGSDMSGGDMSGGEGNASPPPVKKKKLWFKRPTRPALVEKEEVHKATSTATATSTSTTTNAISSSPSLPAGVKGKKGEKKVKAAETSATPSPAPDGDGGKNAGKSKSLSVAAGDGAGSRRKGSKDAASFFIRSENVYTAIVADEKKQRAKKKKEGKKRKSEGRDEDSGDREVEMEEVSDDDDDNIRIVNKSPPRKKSLTPPPQIYVPKATTTRSPSTSKSTSQARPGRTPTPSHLHPTPAPSQPSSQRKPGAPMTITLDSDSDDDNNTPIPTSTAADDLPPPILPDLEARARALASPPPTTTANTSHLSLPPSTITTTTANLDPTRSIAALVSSPLPHTRPLLAKIRLNQKLRAVRQAWCRYQFTPEQIQAGIRINEAEIFLTYKGRKVFDANTFLGIGAGAGEDDTSRIDWGVEGGGEGGGRDNKADITFTAVDEPTFQRMREEAANTTTATNHIDSTSLSTSNPTNPTNLTNPPMSTASDIEIQPSHSGGRDNSDNDEETPDGSLRLILRGKGMEEFKIKVKPETRVSRIIAVLVQQREALRTEGKKIVLKWDGEEADPEGRVGDMEWEDKDVVEVWVK